MKIVIERPPIWDRLDAILPSAQMKRRAIFCWGNTIYNPDNINVTRALLEHEGVHRRQQMRPGTSPEAWWDLYLVDPAFRLSQELPAHQREYWAYCDTTDDRRQRDFYRQQLARRISGPLYGRAISFNAAMKAIA